MKRPGGKPSAKRREAKKIKVEEPSSSDDEPVLLKATKVYHVPRKTRVRASGAEGRVPMETEPRVRARTTPPTAATSPGDKHEIDLATVAPSGWESVGSMTFDKLGPFLEEQIKNLQRAPDDAQRRDRVAADVGRAVTSAELDGHAFLKGQGLSGSTLDRLKALSYDGEDFNAAKASLEECRRAAIDEQAGRAAVHAAGGGNHTPAPAALHSPANVRSADRSAPKLTGGTSGAKPVLASTIARVCMQGPAGDGKDADGELRPRGAGGRDNSSEDVERDDSDAEYVSDSSLTESDSEDAAGELPDSGQAIAPQHVGRTIPVQEADDARSPGGGDSARVREAATRDLDKAVAKLSAEVKGLARLRTGGTPTEKDQRDAGNLFKKLLEVAQQAPEENPWLRVTRVVGQLESLNRDDAGKLLSVQEQPSTILSAACLSAPKEQRDVVADAALGNVRRKGTSSQVVWTRDGNAGTKEQIVARAAAALSACIAFKGYSMRGVAEPELEGVFGRPVFSSGTYGARCADEFLEKQAAPLWQGRTTASASKHTPDRKTQEKIALAKKVLTAAREHFEEFAANNPEAYRAAWKCRDPSR